MNENFGYLKIESFISDNALPISNATITVFNNDQQPLASFTTNSDGISKTIPLPTVSRDLSQSPGLAQPYSTYDVQISHPDFNTKYFKGVPIFPNIVTIQRVSMLPINEAGQTEIISEAEPANL